MGHAQSNMACGNGFDRAHPYHAFELVLMVTGACNLRCRYCYVSAMPPTTMPLGDGQHAIDRAVRSLADGGRLELGFFGGEPLLQPDLVGALADYAVACCRQSGHELSMQLTTNGTLAAGKAWDVMRREDMQVAVSCDGPDGVHDLNRRTAGGHGSAEQVATTIHRLLAEGRNPWVICVVGPETVASLPQGIMRLAAMGITDIQPSLNLWARWSDRDITALEQALAECADLWKSSAGRLAIGWFDEMAGAMAGVRWQRCARCAFGAGQIAVTPAGNLYPCERLIGGDRHDNPWRLAGKVTDDADFLSYRPYPQRSHPACQACTIRDFCNTTCRCSNFVRTGDATSPDRLLCRLNQACFREMCRVLEAPPGQARPLKTSGT